MKKFILYFLLIFHLPSQAQSLIYKRPTLDKDQAYQIFLTGEIYQIEYLWLKSTYPPDREFFASLMLLRKNVDIVDGTFNRLKKFSNRFATEEKAARLIELKKAAINMNQVATAILKSKTYQSLQATKQSNHRHYWSYLNLYSKGKITISPESTILFSRNNP